MKASDASWFRPMWRRVAIAVFLTVWLAWEMLWTKDQFWAFLVGAALVYSLYNFFYAFPKEKPTHEPIQPPPAADRDDGPRP